jgi:hypothetical protein
LKKEYATLETEKRELYNGYREAREDMIDLQKARQNVQMFLDEPRQPNQLIRSKNQYYNLSQ